MGQHKSKVVQERHLQESREERRKRRKWRKKQGYSLPTGLDTVGIVNAGKSAISHTDLPDLDHDDAILVSYSQSNAEKFSHLRPLFAKQYHRRASSEEPAEKNCEIDDDTLEILNHEIDTREILNREIVDHVQVIRINSSEDNIIVPTSKNINENKSIEKSDPLNNKTVVAINTSNNNTDVQDVTDVTDVILDDDEAEILNVIEDSFIQNNISSPKLDQEDIDLLNALMNNETLVKEPSFVIGPDPDPEFKEWYF